MPCIVFEFYVDTTMELLSFFSKFSRISTHSFSYQIQGSNSIENFKCPSMIFTQNTKHFMKILKMRISELLSIEFRTIVLFAST